MAEQQTPEMLRLSLQDLVLRIKICKLGSIEHILSEALDPPSSKNIRRAIESLVDVKALTATEDLTPLGRQLARLPLDVFLGKLILVGSIFQTLDGALTIAAILSSKSPFSAPMGARSQADTARLAYKKGLIYTCVTHLVLADFSKVILTCLLYTMHTVLGVVSVWQIPPQSNNSAGRIS